MWPYIIKEPIPIGTYGVMMAVGFLTAFWLLSRDLRRRNIDVKHAERIIFLGIVGGVLGAKLCYMFTEAEEIALKDFFSGSGLTWHGGLILATTAIISYIMIKKLPLLATLDATAPELATGYACGRIGCQLAGDGDYGIPCNPGDIDQLFCMSYPNGIVPTRPAFQEVHPTPVYEALSNFALFGILWLIRKRIKHPGVLFALYLVGAGILRFAIEFIRQDEGRPDRIAGLRDAQLIALGEVLLGVALWVVSLLLTVKKGQEYGVMPAPVPVPATASGKKKKRR